MSRVEKKFFAMAILVAAANVAQAWWFWHRLADAALRCGLSP